MRDQIGTIVIGSTVKGLVAGVLIGAFATRVRSLAWVLIFGVLVSGFFAYLVAAMQGKYYLADHHARRPRRPHRRLRGVQIPKLEERS